MASLALSVLCGAAVMAGGVLVDTATADSTITITMANGGSIRYDEPTGIRFETTYSGDFTSVNLSNYSFGTLVLPTDKLGEGEQLTHETADVVNIVKKVWYSETDTDKVLYAVITGIEEEDYGRELAARSYYKDKSTGEYTYSTTTVKRSVAQVAANRLNMGDTEAALWTYVNAVAQGVTVSTSTLEMVVGGKETLTATTSPASYNVVWSSADETIATVDKNGTITAVKKGTVEITAKFGEYESICTVTIGDYIQKDGGEFTYTTANPTAERYAATTDVIGTRTGVYKYTGDASADDWTNKLKLTTVGHLSSEGSAARVAALNEWKTSGYKYATFDIYMTKGSLVRITALETSTTSITDMLIAGSTYGASNAEKGDNANIQVYNLDSTAEVSKIANDTWYTVVIDYTNIDVAEYETVANSVYSYVELGGARGTFYVDNVRYYANDTWKNELKGYRQYDGSEFVTASTLAEGSSYALEASEIYGRTGVYKFTSVVSGWKDKLSVKQTNYSGTQFVGTTPGSAIKNMQAQNYAYVTFDVLCISGGIAISSPEYTVTDGVYTFKDQTYRNSWATETAASKSSNIVIYKSDDAEKTDLTAGLSTKTWYTVVVKYDVDATYGGSGLHGIDISSIHGSTVFYFDNVRYYSYNPLEA